MSLSRQVKQELARLEEPLNCCCSWELKALLLRNGYLTIRQGMHVLSVVVEDSPVARRLFYLLRKVGVASPAILKQQEQRLQKTQYLVQVTGNEQVDALLIYLNLKEADRLIRLPRSQTALPKRSCCRKAFIRGIFLAGGSISISRHSGYHLEINCGSYTDGLLYQKVFGYFNVSPSLRRHKGNNYLYLKNAEAIADFLRIIGAGYTLLELESIRVLKSVRAQVNRLVNCDTANLEKIISSAQQQLELIDLVDRSIGLSNLSPNLQEAAMIRRHYPEASLKELGEMLDPPISKSGMSHRFRQLERIINKDSTLKIQA